MPPSYPPWRKNKGHNRGKSKGKRHANSAQSPLNSTRAHCNVSTEEMKESAGLAGDWDWDSGQATGGTPNWHSSKPSQWEDRRGRKQK